MNKLVTIIMPVYNGLPYVVEAIDSILNQTYQNIEFIVINDASTDNSLQILEKYKNKLTIINNEENLGIYGTMNKGIEIATGEYIAIYHADDIYLPTMVEKEVAFLDTYPDCGAVFCSDIFVDKDGKEYERLNLPPEVSGGKPLDYKTIINAELTYKNIFLVCPTCMIRKAVHEKIGTYNQTVYKNSADLEMYMRISKSYTIGILEEYLFLYRHGHGNSSQRYHHLRTDPQRFFMIMDDVLADGANKVATNTALKHFEAHRSQENIMCAISAYIKNDLLLSKSLLNKVSIPQLLKSKQIQRLRMFTMFFVLQLLTRTNHSKKIADIFYKRWHKK